jgi:hypothetical protein
MIISSKSKIGNEKGYTDGPGCCCLGCISGFLALFAGATILSSLLPILLVILLVVLIGVGIAALIKYLKS